MLYRDKIIEERFEKYKIMKYLENKLDRAGLASVDIQRTPLVTRITLEVLNPARIIGRRGRLIDELTTEIRSEFSIENPQINVVEVRNQFLEPRLVAKRASRYIEMGRKVRAVLHFFLREIIRAGALGAEIVAAGKIGAKGARAKTLRVSGGYIPKAGDPARLVHKSHINANTKSGVIGILVRIVPPGTVFPDKESTSPVQLPKIIQSADSVDREKEESGGTPVKRDEKQMEKKPAAKTPERQKEVRPAEKPQEKNPEPKKEEKKSGETSHEKDEPKQEKKEAHKKSEKNR